MKQVKFRALGIECKTKHLIYTKMVNKSEPVKDQLMDMGYFDITILESTKKPAVKKEQSGVGLTFLIVVGVIAYLAYKLFF